jgi:hypothetical protein
VIAMKPSPPSTKPDSAGTFRGRVGRWTSSALSLLAGLAAALVLHYLLYRVGLPSKPFIYVAF